jgi:alkanesulfonate monooxygenase SsuD/methylene tetrahydromethanopterin reductase-like flavin-dependent oxidoreductase (luciferase family)
MEFNHFLSAYYPDTGYSGKRLYDDMLAQARLADTLGYRSVSIPEHHLINILLTPAPLQMAVRVASETENVEIVTAVAVLPLHDMRIFAGEVAQADILCDGRLVLGVGRGAFAYEMARMGVPLEISREKFDESLNVLMALLSGEEVAWDGKYYKFAPITSMPRPLTEPMPQMMIAALAPEAIYHSTKRGFHIQTTPLQGDFSHLLSQVDAFRRGKEELGADGEHLRLSLLRVVYAARDEADAREKVALANGYFSRFDNVFTGPGIVSHGAIEPLPRDQTIEELADNLVICPPDEMVERLGAYAEAGIDELIVNVNIGAAQEEAVEAMERFAAEVMPHFTAAGAARVA